VSNTLLFHLLLTAAAVAPRHWQDSTAADSAAAALAYFAAPAADSTPSNDLLKFCQKVLDILTNREHYGPTLGR
jgi:hypothetical protein